MAVGGKLLKVFGEAAGKKHKDLQKRRQGWPEPICVEQESSLPWGTKAVLWRGTPLPTSWIPPF